MPLVLVDLLSYTGTKGGIETYARELYRHIGQSPAEFTFIGLASTELAKKDSSWFPGRVVDSGISGENRFSWARGELFAVEKVARAHGADLIHGPAMFGPLFPKRPVVISVHDLLYFSHPELMQTKLYTAPVKWMERRGAAKASRLITISDYTARAIAKYLRFPADRVDVIPLAGVVQPMDESSSTPRLPAQFLAMGQRSPYKNFEALVRAMATIAVDERPKLIITGSHGNDPLVPLVEALEVGQWVELKRWVSSEELNELKLTATALLDPTLATGFSLPALEAMMTGLPVLMSDTEVFREVGGDAAGYFDPTDPSSIGRSMVGLVSDPMRQRQMADAGRSWVKQFSWNRVADATLASFRAALD